jgi:hypothetical protein
MNKKEPKKKLVGPWRGLHAAIWLVGLYILLANNNIFPGILVLLAISAIYEGLLAKFAPHAFQEEIPDVPESTDVSEPTPDQSISAPVSASDSPAVQEHRIELLPHICPNCNAPIRGNSVKWTGPQSADCPYCGSNIPMSKV